MRPKRLLFILLSVLVVGYHILAGQMAIRLILGDFPLQQHWVTNVGERIAKLIIISDGTIIVRTDHSLISLDAKTGDIHWRLAIESGLEPEAPLINGNKIFVANDEYVLAINKSTGDILWRQAIDNWLTTELAVKAMSQCCVFISEMKGRLTALNRESGEKLWEFPVGGGGYASINVEGNNIFVLSNGFFILDQEAGGVIWEERSSHHWYSTYFQGEIAFAEYGNQMIAAINFRERKVLWEYSERHHVHTILSTERYLIVVADHIYALNPQNGELIWSTDWGGDKATIMDNRIYLLHSTKKQVRVFDLHTGKWLGSIQLALPSLLQINYVSEAIGTYEDLLIVGVDERVYGFGQP